MILLSYTLPLSESEIFIIPKKAARWSKCWYIYNISWNGIDNERDAQ